MPKLPDKYSPGALQLVGDNPMAPEDGQPSGAPPLPPPEEDGLKVADAASDFLRRKIDIDSGFERDADHDSAGARFKAAIDAARAESVAGLSEGQRAQFDSRMAPLVRHGQWKIEANAAQRRREAEDARLAQRIGEDAAALQGADLASQAAGLDNIAGTLKAAVAGGLMSAERAQALGQQAARQIDVGNFDRLPAEQRQARLAALEAGKAGAGPGRTFDQDLLRQKRAELEEDLRLQESEARAKAERERIESGAQAMLDRFGSSTEGEAKARAEIGGGTGDDPKLLRFYEARLQNLRREERRGQAQSAASVYRLALEGRESEIDAADAKRLNRDGALAEVLEAAQFARLSPGTGDVLFRERYEAMGEEERARFKPAELAQKLAPQDFLEVMQGASGDIDEGQRSRMQSFVQAVKPILGAVTLGEYATPQENERDRRLLELIRDEVRIQTADQEKKKGRELSAWEYENLMRDAVGISLLRHERSELERRGMAWPVMERPDMAREVQ